MKRYNICHDRRTPQMFVSPFGIGEFSGKDYEIIMAGALMIKPLANRLEAYPNIYSSSITVSTQPDFSDLDRKVMRILNSKQGMRKAQKMVDKGRTLLRMYGKPEQFAQDVDALLSKVILQTRTANSNISFISDDGDYYSKKKQESSYPPAHSLNHHALPAAHRSNIRGIGVISGDNGMPDGHQYSDHATTHQSQAAAQTKSKRLSTDGASEM